MNTRQIYMLTLICLVVCAGEVFPAEQDQLSIRQALDQAFSVNPSLRQSRKNLDETKVRADIAAIDTSLTAAASANSSTGQDSRDTSAVVSGRWERKEPSGSSSSVEYAPIGIGDDRGALALQHRIPLVRGKNQLSSKYNEIMNAQSALRIQEKQEFLTSQATVLAVISSYLGAVLAREQIIVQEKALSVTQEAATSARKRADAGLIAELEVSRADINVAQTQDALNSQVQAYRAAVDNLMQTIGQGVGQDPVLTDSVPEVVEQLPPLNLAVEQALQNRAELSVYDQQIADRTRKTLIKSDQLAPSLDAVAGFSTFNNRSGVLSSSIFNRGSLTFGLEYRITLDKRILTAEKEIDQRDLLLFADLRAYEMEKIAADVREAYRSVQRASDSLSILGQNLETTQENLRLAQRMVEEGLSSNREVLDAQTALTRVESGVLSAKLQLYMATLNLKSAMGEDLSVTVMQ